MSGDRHSGCLAGYIETPLGTMLAIVDAAGALVRLDFEGDARAQRRIEPGSRQQDMESGGAAGNAIRDDGAVAPVARQLEEYFAGERRRFTLSLAPRGNAFLHEAWARLAEVPYGSIISYGELAKRLGRPTSARAIGRANAVNPISIIVPCHRVIGADGKLTGYGGGLERKAALLRLEGVLAQEDLFFDRPDGGRMAR
jgi:methylated-DNA-[protein]-cysteine S-methyltransferase